MADEQAQPLSPFERYDEADVIALIASYPLAWVTVDDGPASLLPLLADLDDAGRLVGLIGHLPYRNPLFSALVASPRARLLFTGPQGYVSPALVSRPDWAPTWNYAQAAIDAEIAFDENFGDEALNLLVDHTERDRARPWRTSEMGPRYDLLRAQIVGFRARILRCTARFKLAQDEAPETLAEILAGHSDPALVEWMRRMNAGRA